MFWHVPSVYIQYLIPYSPDTYAVYYIQYWAFIVGTLAVIVLAVLDAMMNNTILGVIVSFDRSL
jgi:hypothetical protein